MADTIVGGLFGIDPYQRQQEQAKLLNTQAQQFAELDPFQKANYALYSGGAKLGNLGAGLMGAQDPQLVAQQTAQQLSSQFDMTSPQGLKDYSAALLKAGQEANNPTLSNFGMMALDKARQADLSQLAMKKEAVGIEREQATIEKEKAALNKIQFSSEQEAKLRSELAALPANATDEQYLSVIKKFAGAGELLKVLEMKQIKQMAIETKNAPVAEQARLAKEASAATAIDSLALVSDLDKRVSNWTTGAGSFLGKIPLTSAKDFAADTETLKARLSADVIAEMKTQSKTGATGLGALNLQELKMIQSKIANLDPGQSPEQFQRQLNEIKRYYQKRAGMQVDASQLNAEVATSANGYSAWLKAAKEANPSASDADLKAFYDNKYGKK